MIFLVVVDAVAENAPALWFLDRGLSGQAKS